MLNHLDSMEKVIRNLDFDHPFRVDEEGFIQDDVRGIYAPEVLDEVIFSDAWEPINGYSGQDRYSGPVMHNSEYLGGGMLRDILQDPGVYVLVACYWSSENEQEETETDIEGWMLLRLK